MCIASLNQIQDIILGQGLGELGTFQVEGMA